jgi:hypothetical protein
MSSSGGFILQHHSYSNNQIIDLFNDFLINHDSKYSYANILFTYRIKEVIEGDTHILYLLHNGDQETMYDSIYHEIKFEDLNFLLRELFIPQNIKIKGIEVFTTHCGEIFRIECNDDIKMYKQITTFECIQSASYRKIKLWGNRSQNK